MKATQAALRLYLAPGIGCITAHKLIEAFGSMQAIWEHDVAAWAAISGVGRKLLQSLQAAQHIDLQRILDSCSQHHIHIITLEDAAYPEALRHIPDAPLALFVIGNPEVLHHPQTLAVVGSRRCSQESKVVTRRWCQHFSDVGVHIVSGMAYGVDAAAHGGAIQGRTPTTAVLGCGLLALQARQQDQVRAITEHGGCVISEYMPETQARAELFPKRNRIIAGLATGTLIMEAALRSGSLITARLANEYGREVFAVPGSVLHDGHTGCHQLIRDGATLVDTPETLMHTLQWHTQTPNKTIPLPENPSEQAIIEALQHGILHVDSLAERCSLTVSQLSTILLALELRGVVERLPGSRYTLGG